MIRPKLRQALSLFLVPVFALGLLGGAYGFHGCPRHAGTGHPAQAPAAAGGAVPWAAASAARSTAHRAADPAVPAAVPDDGGRPGAPFCICVGSCHAGAAAAHPGSAGRGLAAAAPAFGPAARIAQAVPPHATPAYFLPYALGPPAG